MHDVRQTIDRYFASWNTVDPEARRRLIAATWSEDGTYLDPLLAGDGLDGIDAMIGAVQAQFPGHTLHLAGPIDCHNGHARFAWEMHGPDDDAPVLRGVDFAVLGTDGRLQSVTGFLDSVPAGLLAR